MIPYLKEREQQRDGQSEFGGYRNRLSAGPLEFKSMLNMGSDEAPMLATRKRRRKIRTIEHGTALLGGDTLSWVDGGTLYYGGKPVVTGISDGAQLVRMGAYLIVWPDKVIYNTFTGEETQMDYAWTMNGVHVRPCMLSGQDLTYVAGDEEPENPRDQMYWLNTSVNAMYQYLGGVWTGIDTVYSRLEGVGIGAGLKEYDVVTISGMDDDDFNIDGATVYARADDYIVIATGVIVDFENDGEVTVKRTAPELERIVENGNRLWGYSNKTHEIRCCKLGDPTNWSSYLGISTDSYAATVGSQGDFTGIYAYMGYVHFFKENRVHRLYGTQPSNFQLVELQMRGVKPGCGQSLCVVNEMLYYMSRDGVMRYDGSSPVDMSEPLGDVKLENVVCGAHNHKLYLSAVEDGQPVMYALDTARMLWHREDSARAISFAGTTEGDFFLDDTGSLWSIDGARSALEDAGAQDEGDLPFMAASGDMLTETTREKVLKRLEVRLAMERGARVELSVMYNTDGRWHRVLSYETEAKKTVMLPIMARSCDHMAVRISGTGRVVVYNITKIFEVKEGRACLNYRA